MPADQELIANGYARVGKNLWTRTIDGIRHYEYQREGTMTTVAGLTAEDARKYGVEVGKLPEATKSKAEAKTPSGGLESWGGSIATINTLRGDDYQAGRELAERIDDDQIVRELAGEVLQEFTYKFTVGGRDVVGLSYSGIKHIAQNVGNIEILEANHEDLGAHWFVKCKGVNRTNGLVMVGVAQQSKSLKRKDGSEAPDDYALTKAYSKASRNTIRALIPETVALQLLRKWLEAAQAKR